MGSKINIKPSFFLMGALGILLIPTRWGIGALLAAMVHEVFHCIAIFLCGGRILSISLGIFGARMEISPMDRGNEVLCALAGPAGSFSMLLMAEHYPEAALCGLIQGAYNLMPLYPLDGGRALRCLLAESICTGVQIFSLVFLTGLGLWITIFHRMMGFVFLLSLWIPILKRKISCNAA